MLPNRILSTAAVALLLAAAPGVLRSQATEAAQDSAAAAAARQLELGEQWFHSACVQCHAVGVLVNADFRLKWSGRSAFDLFERIRSTMPGNSPGSLTQGTYAAIVAYLMKRNGMPVGARRLSSDSLSLVSIQLMFSDSLSTPTR